jgi:hypothetical protein
MRLREKATRRPRVSGPRSTLNRPLARSVACAGGITVSRQRKFARRAGSVAGRDLRKARSPARGGIGRRILMRLSTRAGYGDRVAGSHPAPLPQRGTGLARSGTGPSPSPP